MSQSENSNNKMDNQCDNGVPKNESDASDVKNLIKERNKIRRAFSMPRSIPLSFRLSVSRRKNNKDSSAINETNAQINATTDPAVSIPSDNNCCTEQTKTKNFRRSWKKFLSRVAQQMTSINIGAKQTTTDRVPPLGGYVWPPDQIPGVTGLKNHGNTCFMNAVLQCLSHTDILAEYFVLDQYKADLKRRNKLTSRKFGTKGELTEQLALVLKALWTCKIESDYSTSFKAVVDRYGSQFRSSTQHDAQEFLFWLLDKVHEDLNTASKRKYRSMKNNYGRPDEVIAAETLANHIRCNNSFVQAVFQAQFRSSLSCPRCHKQSNTFDPFHCISVQLPQLAQQAVFVTVLYASQHPRQVKLGLGVPPGSPMVAIREQLQADTGIPLERIVLAEITEAGFSRVFCDSHPISSLSEDDSIYCIETQSTADDSTNLTLIVANVQRNESDGACKRFGTPFCLQVSRDVSYNELQKKLLKEMQTVLKSDVFSYSTPPSKMFKIRLQDVSADPDTYIEPTVEHPLFTEMIDLALAILPSDGGPPHVKLLLEWSEPEKYFSDLTDPFVEHESVSQMKERCNGNSSLTLEQCLEHYTKAETLSAEDAWRCPHCQKYLPVVKTLGLWSLPDILVIHFKRFRQQYIKGPQAAKLTTTVKFPLHGFDMTPHLARDPNVNINDSEENWSPWRKQKRRENCMQPKDNRYDLYAVCYHQGDTLETGHYTAACKNPYDHQWYKFDDQKVSLVPGENIPADIVNNEAYMLFYQRRKVDNMECSGTSSTSGDHWVSKIAVAPTLGEAPSTSVLPTTEKVNANNKRSAEVECEQVIVDADVVPSTSKCDKPSVEPQVNPPSPVAVTKFEVNVEINESKPVVNGTEAVTKIDKIDDDVIDVDGLDGIDDTTATPIVEIPKLENVKEDIHHQLGGVELRSSPIKKDDGLSTSVPNQRTLWPHEHTPPVNRGSLSDMFVSNFRRDHRELRHSMSNSSTMRQKEETIAMIRGSNSCSKDTLLFIDQQNHGLIDDDYLGNRSLWISPVTPHKLITVSPKN
ncbi:ubiquitin carboxyl-terminal hydrolase 31 [Bradysia coprophila]|uniref:ubiquitin carboxyl-terminal hydrolase 31 n=1 Tax=Bradysia coprophila TaxID=38358 RepID=UPI00187DD496|nr:ubiquitin carboxyl-terminal hydrolase 31 [Bradysia coprophila]